MISSERAEITKMIEQKKLVNDDGAVCEKLIVRNMMKRVLSLRGRDLIWRNVQRRGCLLCATGSEAAGPREANVCRGKV